MTLAQEYLDSTESAARHFLVGIAEYLDILQINQGAAPTGAFEGDEAYRAALEKWVSKDSAAIEKSLESQRKFTAEKSALATLCGALLQVAATGIRMYSRNEEVPDEFAKVIKPHTNAAKYCIGRTIRSVPLGLIVYAGRNQYNHIDDGKLHEPNLAIFDRLATCHNYGIGIRDPALDLQKNLGWNYPSNITHIIGWRSYDTYSEDMASLLIG